MMQNTTGETIELVLGWDDLGETAGIRRNQSGFSRIKTLAAVTNPGTPFKLNAFLYIFFGSAKNLDLVWIGNTKSISCKISKITKKMAQISDFEREAKGKPSDEPMKTYLALRKVVARRTARDERRTLATLLFSGPSTAKQVAADLGISTNLVERVFRALEPVLQRLDDKQVQLRDDSDNLAAVLHLLRSTMGVDPLAVLQRRISAQTKETR